MNNIIVIVPGLPVDYTILDGVVFISPELADQMIQDEIELLEKEIDAELQAI